MFLINFTWLQNIGIDPLHVCGDAANLEDKTKEIFASVKQSYCSVLQIGCIPTDVQGVYIRINVLAVQRQVFIVSAKRTCTRSQRDLQPTLTFTLCSTQTQIALITKFVSIAKYCYEMRNFASSVQIIDALEMFVVRQLPVSILLTISLIYFLAFTFGDILCDNFLIVFCVHLSGLEAYPQ